MKYKILLFLSCLILNACATKVKPEQVNMCPPCAVAGPKVAEEFEKVCDEKKCPWKDCVRHPESGFTYNSMGHLSYLCKKFKEVPKEVEEIKETEINDSKDSN